MRNLLKTTALLAFLVLGASSVADAQVSFGIQIGPPPPPRAYIACIRRGRRRLCGWMGTGRRGATIIVGITATGRGRHIAALAGSLQCERGRYYDGRWDNVRTDYYRSDRNGDFRGYRR
jgi:hypothetical protein